MGTFNANIFAVKIGSELGLENGMYYILCKRFNNKHAALAVIDMIK